MTTEPTPYVIETSEIEDTYHGRSGDTIVCKGKTIAWWREYLHQMAKENGSTDDDNRTVEKKLPLETNNLTKSDIQKISHHGQFRNHGFTVVVKNGRAIPRMLTAHQRQLHSKR